VNGLFDFLRTPAGQGLLSAGLGVAANAGRGGTWNAIGRGGLLGLRGYAGAENAQLGLRKSRLEISELERKYKDDAAGREVLQDYYRNRGAAGGAQDSGQASLPAFSLPAIGGEPAPGEMGPARPSINSFDFLHSLPSLGRQDGGGYGGQVSASQVASGGYAPSSPSPAARIDGNDFVLAAQKNRLGTDMHTLNKIVDLVNGGMSVDEAARQVAGDGGSSPAAGGPQAYGGHGSSSGVRAGGASARPRSALFDQYSQLGDAFAAKGLAGKAQQYYELAEKYRPKYNTTPQFMTGPGGKLVPVLIGEDGATQELGYGPKPDITIEDLGGTKRVIDKNNLRGDEIYRKGLTPGEAASNQISRERLALDRDTPQYITQDGVTFAVPKRPQPGAPIIGRPVVLPNGGEASGFNPKLTEAQSKAMAFASRMVDSNKVIDELEGQAYPSSVARAGYQADVPSWVPGGQAFGAGVTALNNWTTPETAQQLYQGQTNWVTANLRKESGAVIAPAEMQAEIRKYFPQPGDSQAVIDQKRKARRVAQEAMVAEAGPGGRQIPGILDKAKQAEDGRKGRESSNKAMASLPTPNVSNKGRKVRDNDTGKIYQSNGMSWQEVR